MPSSHFTPRQGTRHYGTVHHLTPSGVLKFNRLCPSFNRGTQPRLELETTSATIVKHDLPHVHNKADGEEQMHTTHRREPLRRAWGGWRAGVAALTLVPALTVWGSRARRAIQDGRCHGVCRIQAPPHGRRARLSPSTCAARAARAACFSSCRNLFC